MGDIDFSVKKLYTGWERMGVIVREIATGKQKYIEDIDFDDTDKAYIRSNTLKQRWIVTYSIVTNNCGYVAAISTRTTEADKIVFLEDDINHDAEEEFTAFLNEYL